MNNIITFLFHALFTRALEVLFFKGLSPRYQGLISQTFYKQLLQAQVPKAQKDTDDLPVFCTFGIFAHKSCS